MMQTDGLLTGQATKLENTRRKKKDKVNREKSQTSMFKNKSGNKI